MSEDRKEDREEEVEDTRTEWQKHIGVGEKIDTFMTVPGGYQAVRRRNKN